MFICPFCSSLCRFVSLFSTVTCLWFIFFIFTLEKSNPRMWRSFPCLSSYPLNTVGEETDSTSSRGSDAINAAPATNSRPKTTVLLSDFNFYIKISHLELRFKNRINGPRDKSGWGVKCNCLKKQSFPIATSPSGGETMSAQGVNVNKNHKCRYFQHLRKKCFYLAVVPC